MSLARKRYSEAESLAEPAVSHPLLAHTADLRAELEAADLPGLYLAAARLVREALVGESPVAAREERALPAQEGDEAERFFRFVRELVYLFDAEGFLPAAVRLGDPPRLAGERFDPARHVSERQIKAVTRHGYIFERTAAGGGRAPGFRVELVFDL